MAQIATVRSLPVFLRLRPPTRLGYGDAREASAPESLLPQWGEAPAAPHLNHCNQKKTNGPGVVSKQQQHCP